MIYTRRSYCAHPELVEGVLPSHANRIALARLHRQTVEAPRGRRSARLLPLMLLGIALLPLAAQAHEKLIRPEATNPVPATSAPTAEPASIVRKGQPVSLHVADTDVVIAAAGRALTDGAEGSRIPVRTLSSQTLVEGVVIAPGTVSVATLKVPEPAV